MNGGEIISKRIMLRPMHEDDAEFIVNWRNDPEIKQWFFLSDMLTRESHLEWFRRTRKERIDYMTCLIPGLRPFGTVNYSNINKTRKSAEAGKMLGDKGLWGKGLGEEAFRVWIRYGLNILGFNEIYIQTYSDNKRNIELNKKIGFHIEKVIEYGGKKYKRNVTLMKMYREDAITIGLIKEEI